MQVQYKRWSIDETRIFPHKLYGGRGIARDPPWGGSRGTKAGWFGFAIRRKSRRQPAEANPAQIRVTESSLGVRQFIQAPTVAALFDQFTGGGDRPAGCPTDTASRRGTAGRDGRWMSARTGASDRVGDVPSFVERSGFKALSEPVRVGIVAITDENGGDAHKQLASIGWQGIAAANPVKVQIF